MASKYVWKPIIDFTGGRNATDDPLSLTDNEVAQMRNGDSWRTKLFRKRGGAAAPSIGSTFTGVISSLIAHFPGNNPANAELWGADDATPPVIGRMAGASTFAAPTLKDNPATGAGPSVRGFSFNGKIFLLYDSAVDRSHVYDPTLASPSVRRLGLATPSAPTAADTGSGSYAATIRYYRQRYRIKNGAAVVAQSEPSASVSFTPSGTGTHARVTKSATISESETHWVVEASPDDITFYEIAEVAVGTTTYDDSATVSNYSTNDLSPVLGAYTAPASYKYGLAAFNRALFLGTWESGGLQSSVYYTPARGTSDKADDERIPDTLFLRNRVDLDEGTGGDGTGLAGPMYGAVYVFKYNAIAKLLPTGAASPVWDVIDVSSTYGAIEQECIAVAQYLQGDRRFPAIYFLDPQVGPMVVGPVPPTEIGHGVRDQWDSVNLAATIKVGWVLDYPAKDEVWFAWATGANNSPNILARYHKRTGAWSVDDTGGQIRLGRSAALFARTLGASMSRDKVPYVGYASANNTLLRGDTTGTDDDGTTFQAIVKTRPYNWNNGQPFRMTAPVIVAKPQSGVTLTITADADFGRETRSTTISLTATASETGATRIIRTAEGLDFANLTWLQLQIGDASAIANTWQIERIYVPVLAENVGP